MSSDKSSGDKSKFEIPKFDIPKVDLNSAIKAGVQKTNSLLATLESEKVQTSTIVSSRLRPLLNQGYKYAQKGVVLYERRKYYGPQIIGGTAVVVGGLVGIRRGKIPGMFMGGLGGAGSYSFVYGITSEE
jgi:hypothetical protein